MKIIPSFPYRNLDGTPQRWCDHQHQSTDKAELAVIEGVGKAIIKAGIPKVLARAGETVKTTWGCEKNKRLTHRSAVIYRVEVALIRHPQSMFYRPQIFYYGQNHRHEGMVLDDFETTAGIKWEIPKGERIPITFVLEWLNDQTGVVESVPGTGVHFISESF